MRAFSRADGVLDSLRPNPPTRLSLLTRVCCKLSRRSRLSVGDAWMAPATEAAGVGCGLDDGVASGGAQ